MTFSPLFFPRAHHKPVTGFDFEFSKKKKKKKEKRIASIRIKNKFSPCLTCRAICIQNAFYLACFDSFYDATALVTESDPQSRIVNLPEHNGRLPHRALSDPYALSPSDIPVDNRVRKKGFNY